MFKTTKAVIAGAIFGLIFTTVAFAQQPAPQTQTQAPGIQRGQRLGRMGMRRAMRRRARMGGLGALRQLDLTDAQQQQARTIVQSNFANTKAAREELAQLIKQRREEKLSPEGIARAKELRAQLQQSRQGVRTQLTGLLTAEQKARLEEMIKNRRANHERSGLRRPMPNKPL